MDFSAFNSAEQAHMNKIIEKKQMQDFLRLYANIVERCFSSCCNDFTSKTLSSKEETCVMSCTEKFLKHSERVGSRFAELNAGTQLPCSNSEQLSSCSL
ncbi:Tim10/DDP family zinc finger protein [Lentinula edodes]|uniref:Tim10/DDP family zinc finger protein n=1 Tax=Lentinula edodes TaxID=5353 RepID=UPI001E8EF16C|nr:Tim10/DDP family zinc finger protein [Lentinula edodes]KAH7873141.1 Tim10/DDP family zinc finger protein [Lentinula edodes]KAJ3895423.1 Tim10/DDP family zinc finger protein [Lentinula edodes]KAJ3921334.1 Tim10/DDP family zinc finger protein [Lentinula edodes]